MKNVSAVQKTDKDVGKRTRKENMKEKRRSNTQARGQSRREWKSKEEMFEELPAQALPILQGRVNGHPARMLLDSGAARTLLSDTFVRQYGQRVKEGSALHLQFADGGRHLSSTYVEATITLNELTCKHSLPVAPIAAYDVLLGVDFFARYQPKIHWSDRVITTKSGRVLSSKRLSPAEPNKIQEVSARALADLLRKPVAETYAVLIRTRSENELPQVQTTCAVKEIACERFTAPLAEREHEGLRKQLLQEFPDLFPDDLPQELPPRRSVEHEIVLVPGSAPSARRYYKMSTQELAYLTKTIDDLLSKKLIRPSSSPFAAPVLFVKKADQTLRFCCDYRALNNTTVRNAYPIPDMSDLLDRLRGAKYFSRMDLRSGYHQVRVAERDIHKTAFTTRYGNYEWMVLPFGLCNAPATFQRLMNDVLREFIDKCVVVYLDDVLVYSSTWTDHRHDLRSVCQKLQQQKLYCKPSKCMFGLTTVKFVGHIVTQNQVHMDPDKIKAVADWPVPKTPKDLRGFLGFANFYRKFISRFAHIAQPLTELLRGKPTSIAWGDPQQRAFDTLKRAICSQPVLSLPDMQKPFVLHTDASELCGGAVLSQEGHPIAFLSQRLQGAQLNYDVREKELLALVTALQKWRHYLLDAEVIAFTDHQSLRYLQSKADLGRRLARWLDVISEFKGLTIKYKPGKDNIVADALSRVSAVDTRATISDADMNSIRNGYDTDPYFKDVLRALREPVSQDVRRRQFALDHEGLMYQVQDDRRRLCIPESWKERIMIECHSTPTAGHLGRQKTYARIAQKFYWPAMSKDVRKFTQRCIDCQRNKSTTTRQYGQLQPLEIPTGRWSSVSMDFLTGLPPSGVERYDTILVIVDRLTKRCHLIPTSKTATARDTADLFIKNIVRLHGMPTSIVSDRDPRFTAKFWSELFRMLGTKLKMSTAAHPETDGQTERQNRTLQEMLRTFVSGSSSPWHQHLSMIEFAINSAQHASTGYSPFQLDLGYEPTVPASLLHGDTHSVAPAVNDFIQHLSTTLAEAKDALVRAQQQQATYYNKRRAPDPVFQPGDLVMIHRSALVTPTERERQRSNKLSARWMGPFKIVRRITVNAYKIDLPLGVKAHDTINVSFLKKYHGEAPPEPPPVTADEGAEEYEVERILKRRVRGGKTEYLVRWKGYSPEDDTWEPESHLRNAPGLLQEFNEQY
eukprot:m.219569 g.219569  ORF g.219569 m.219569 type:complete len:1192 (-) comp17002_c0_seq5:791-4366(-)